MSCSKPFGYYNIGNLQTTLRSMPAGYTRAIYLYKSTSYGPQYQGVMDWATSNNNYGWQQGSPNVPRLSLDVSTYGHGWYFVWIQMWAPNGSTDGGWSTNGCWL